MLTAWIGTDAQERAGRTAGVGRTTTKRSESSCSKKTDKVRGRDEANPHVKKARERESMEKLTVLATDIDERAEYAQVLKMLGNGRLSAQCVDGVQRLCHIRGKMRKKVWVNTVRARMKTTTVILEPISCK